jgi:hypothetical protein
MLGQNDYPSNIFMIISYDNPFSLHISSYCFLSRDRVTYSKSNPPVLGKNVKQIDIKEPVRYGKISLIYVEWGVTLPGGRKYTYGDTFRVS